MGKSFRSCNLDQIYLLPPSLQDWLPQNHLARFVAEVVHELDLSAIYGWHEERDGRGLSAYHPELMVRLLLYGYCTGKRSSRQIERATYDEVPFRYLAAEQHPDHDTIAAFRQQHMEALADLFGQVLRLCREAGLVKVGQIAIDSTKMRAQASRRRTLRYEQLNEVERKLEQQIRDILSTAAARDSEEDARYGSGGKPEDLPGELATAEQRLKKIRAAQQKLRQQAEERAQQARTKRQAQGGKHLNNADKKRYQAATRPIEKANPQYNFSDPDSKIMRDAATNSFMQGYNAQLAVDSEQQIIVATDVVAQPADQTQLLPMVKAAQQELHSSLPVVLADAGYFSIQALQDAALQHSQVLVSPDAARTNPAVSRMKHPLALAMRERLSTPEGRRLYAQRKAYVEPVFGYIKAVRGLRSFCVRGLARVRAEWRMICLTHNLLKLHRFRNLPAAT